MYELTARSRHDPCGLDGGVESKCVEGTTENKMRVRKLESVSVHRRTKEKSREETSVVDQKLM